MAAKLGRERGGGGRPPDGVQSALVRDLAAAGLRIVSADPQLALARLEHKARSGRAADMGELHLGDEDDDFDGIAA
ncbi:hypothetical protein GCM10011504_51760 [Siccirubricoccus deserti]|nr:hypothetical protein GCM10011504_51760 [Siccirubricoccus deserti]